MHSWLRNFNPLLHKKKEEELLYPNRYVDSENERTKLKRTWNRFFPELVSVR
jgi:hypothetical protein